MKSLKELLVGYCDPQQLLISQRPIGETGLTRRIASIAHLWEISVSVRRRHFWRFGHLHFQQLFGTFVSAIDQSWLAELLRVMDKPRTGTPRGKLENLTVELCHERFQGEPSIAADLKTEESKHFDALMSAYGAAGLRDFRNQQMFHLDLKTALSSSGTTGDIRSITRLLVRWFDQVGSTVFQAEPRFVTNAHIGGKRTAREFREMLVARLRELVGKPKLNKKRFKSPAWNALCTAVTSPASRDSIDSRIEDTETAKADPPADSPRKR